MAVDLLAIDLFCGLGGWAEGFLAEGYEVIGYDIEAHNYGTGGYPGRLVLRDIREVHGSEFKDATIIVASPPCQAYSYRAMPWKRAKELPPPDNTLFEACFRIQREAVEAAGRYIPLIVENVRGAQKWVGVAGWHYGSFYLWGDVPALMPIARGAHKFNPDRKATKNHGGSWFACGPRGTAGESNNARDGVKIAQYINKRDGHSHTRHLTSSFENAGTKQPGLSGVRKNGKSNSWFQDGAARHGSRSSSRKAASAIIAKIPFPLALYIAQVFKPQVPRSILQEGHHAR